MPKSYSIFTIGFLYTMTITLFGLLGKRELNLGAFQDGGGNLVKIDFWSGDKVPAPKIKQKKGICVIAVFFLPQS